MPAKLTKMEKVEALVDALREEIPVGVVMPPSVWRRIIAKGLNLVARQSFYNNLEVLTDVLGAVEWEDKVGGALLPYENEEDVRVEATQSLPA